MINIERDQKIAENENLKVASPTGSYEDNALIEFYDVANPSLVSGAFQAQYVKYGGFIYRFNNNEELGREILKKDPGSTHSSASFVRMKNELVRQLEGGDLEPQSLNQIVDTEQAKMEQKVQVPNNVGDTSTTTPSSNSNNSFIPETTENSTTTSQVGAGNQIPVENASSTPIGSQGEGGGLVPSSEIPVETSTTTPSVSTDVPTEIVPIDVPTTTPPIIDQVDHSLPEVSSDVSTTPSFFETIFGGGENATTTMPISPEVPVEVPVSPIDTPQESSTTARIFRKLTVSKKIS